MKKMFISVTVIGLLAVGAYATIKSSNKGDMSVVTNWYNHCLKTRGSQEYCKCETRCFFAHAKNYYTDEEILEIGKGCAISCLIATETKE